MGKSLNLIDKEDTYAAVQRYKVSNKEIISFISFHKHQKKNVDTIFHTAPLLGLPEDHQQSYKLITRLGITQDVPKRLKRMLKITEATSQ
jgi:hypothetical protein